jgi:hypothetical protein
VVDLHVEGRGDVVLGEPVGQVIQAGREPGGQLLSLVDKVS